MDFQGEAVVEDLWVAPDMQFDRDLIVSPKKESGKSFFPEKIAIMGKIFSPAFFSLHKVRPLRKVRAELKGDPPALNISENWSRKKKLFRAPLHHLMVAENEQGPGKHDGHAEEEDEEDDDHCDRRHHRVALLDVIVEVFAVAEFVAVAVSDLDSKKRD